MDGNGGMEFSLINYYGSFPHSLRLAPVSNWGFSLFNPHEFPINAPTPPPPRMAHSPPRPRGAARSSRPCRRPQRDTEHAAFHMGQNTEKTPGKTMKTGVKKHVEKRGFKIFER